MTTFDYGGYWLEVVEPAWRALPEETRKLVKTVANHETVKQERGTGLDREAISDQLYNQVTLLPSKDLARAAQVAHDYSHCCPGRDVERLAGQYERIGAGWKFALVADHVLAERHKMAHRGNSYEPKGYFLQNLEGLIRPTFNDANCWMWDEVGLTCEENLEKVAEFASMKGQPNGDTLKDWCRQLIDVLHPVGDPDRDLVTHDRYMVAEETREFLEKFRLAEVLGRPLPTFEPETDQGIMDAIKWVFPDGYGLRPVKLTSINHRLKPGCNPTSPVRRDTRVTSKQLMHHPFVIGPKHVTNSVAGRLNPRSSGCDLCGYDYDQHISDKAIILEHHPDMTTEQAAVAAQHALKDVWDWLNQLGVEHIGLPKSDQAPEPTVDFASLKPLPPHNTAR